MHDAFLTGDLPIGICVKKASFALLVAYYCYFTRYSAMAHSVGMGSKDVMVIRRPYCHTGICHLYFKHTDSLSNAYGVTALMMEARTPASLISLDIS